MFWLLTILLSTVALLFPVWLWRRTSRGGASANLRALRVVLSAALVAAGGFFLEREVVRFAGLSIDSSEPRFFWGPFLMVAFFFAPLEELLKVSAVWPIYRGRYFTSGPIAASYAVLAAGGYAATELLLGLSASDQRGSLLALLRFAIALPAHYFFAGLWGYMLGGTQRDRFFAVTWLGCTAFHGIYDHIVFGRGPAFLVVVVPMLLMMAVGVFGILREGASVSRRSVYSMFEPPSVVSVRRAMAQRGRPLVVPWIIYGAVVTLGVLLVFLAAAVYAGHRLGVDFSLADRAGEEGVVPLVLLGSATLAAFPFSAYLVARASDAVSVLEPAWSTGLAIFAAISLFSITEPTALIVVLAIAPVGFALACAGAWFGLSR